MSELKPTTLIYKLGEDAKLIFESKDGSSSVTEDYITVSEINSEQIIC